MFELAYQLRKCKECSCSRCNLNGTTGCYVDIAIRELNRYEQAFDSFEANKQEGMAGYQGDLVTNYCRENKE